MLGGERSAFVRPAPLGGPAAAAAPSRLTLRLTMQLVETYSVVNPRFRLIDRLPQVRQKYCIPCLSHSVDLAHPHEPHGALLY